MTFNELITEARLNYGNLLDEPVFLYMDGPEVKGLGLKPYGLYIDDGQTDFSDPTESEEYRTMSRRDLICELDELRDSVQENEDTIYDLEDRVRECEAIIRQQRAELQKSGHPQVRQIRRDRQEESPWL